MSARTIIEQTVPARDLPRYVGWQANGIMRRDGALAWGEIVAATPGPTESIDLTYMRNMRQPRGGYVSVPDGALISLRTPLGEHMVTVSHGADVATPGDPHPATCRLCRVAACAHAETIIRHNSETGATREACADCDLTIRTH